MASKVQKGRTRKRRGSTSNRTSQVPENVMEKILMCLPKRDRVRTSLPAIEFLELNHDCLKMISAGGVPEKLPTDLICLKSLNLRIESTDVFSSIICLLRSSPNLEKIAIEVPISAYEDEKTTVKLFEAQGCSNLSLDQLRKVEIREACGKTFVLELIKLLLAKSPFLENMVIVPIYLIVKERLELMKKVAEFRRSSSLAEVCFELPDDDDDEW